MSFKGRGAVSSPQGRFASRLRDPFDDGWEQESEPGAPLRTTVTAETARSIISHNDSPDLPFEQSLNPYRGCEHGCIYCYARPSHAYWDLSPGLDFETRLFAKPNAALLLREALAKPAYHCRPIAIGANTDAYQPIERQWQITRQVLEVLLEARHPATIVTKSALIERDLDLLAEMAARGLVQVMVSVTTLDRELARIMEPRAAAPRRRLETLQALAEVGVPVGVLTAPVIPALNDSDLEAILESASGAGARWAAYTLLRLPYELKDLFREWLEAHHPLKATHVMSQVRQNRGGKENDSDFGSRMRGTGVLADLIERRFQLACRRFGLNRERLQLNCEDFKPLAKGGQLSLF